MKQRQLSHFQDTVEHFFGVACPLLSVISIIDHFGLVRWAWLLLFWMSCGHYALYFYNLYPNLKYRPFTRGLFVFGIGLLWPVWCAAQGRGKRLWG